MATPTVELSALSPERDSAAVSAAGASAAAAHGSRPGVVVLGGAHGAVAAARSLGRRGIPVWFIGDDHPLARYSRYVRRRLRWNGADPEAAVKMLCRLAQDDGIAGWVLFPAGDAEVQLVARHHAELARHFRLFTMPWESLQHLNDKSLLYAMAARVGAAFPHTIDPADPAAVASVHFPVVIKPVSSEVSNALTRAKAWRADTPQDLARRYPQALALMGDGKVVVQEMVPGDGRAQFSYAGLWDRGQEVAFLTARRTRQFPIDFGMTSCFVETMPVPEIADAARRILTDVGFHGLIEVEFKYGVRDNVYKVLDANTRAWAWMGLGSIAGIDFPYLTWQLATGLPVDVSPPARSARWIYISRVIHSNPQEYKPLGRPSPGARRSLVSANASATFAWDDPLPGVVDLPLQVTRLWRRLRPAA
jgi:predicted ATP-grasp superfamily ATP-dependent carboligase